MFKILINLKSIFHEDTNVRCCDRILSKTRERQVVYKTAYEANRKGSHILTENKKQKFHSRVILHKIYVYL